jgi:hypothetical protein
MSLADEHPGAAAPRFLPMGGQWAMPVPVACSLAAVSAGTGFSCGQCPLDAAGRVHSPGDLPVQAALVAAAGLHALEGAGAPHGPALAVIYHTAQDGGGAAALDTALGVFRLAFPGALLAPVALPHFYYPGMTVEADLHWGATAPDPRTVTASGATVAAAGTRPLDRAVVTAPPGSRPADALAAAGLSPERLLAAHWFGPPGRIPDGWHPDPGSAVLPASPDSTLTGVLTLAPAPVTAGRTAGGALLRQGGGFAWLSARSSAPRLADAASAAMDALALERHPALVPLKATTHYAGGPTPEDLHANLAVRHARFPRPGPASTGVPVAGLAGGTLAIDIIAACTA